MPENLTRAFIAISFPSEIIKEILKVQTSLSKKNFTGKLIEEENIHLTLKFLGEIGEEKLKEVKSALSKISSPKFEAHLEKTGTFSKKGAPKIAWIKVASPQIFELQKKIDSALSPLFQKEDKFKPHITIAKIKYIKDKFAFKEYISKIPIKKIPFTISSFSLFSSDLKPLGPTYVELEKYPLND